MDHAQGSVWVPGVLQTSWRSNHPEDINGNRQKVLVKLAMSDWHSFAARCKELRVVQLSYMNKARSSLTLLGWIAQ